MQKAGLAASTAPVSHTEARWRLPQYYLNLVGRRIFAILLAFHGVCAFALITLAVCLRKSRVAPGVIRPLIAREIWGFSF